MTAPAIASTPTNPAELRRKIGDLTFALSAEGLSIKGVAVGPIALDVEDALALFDFARTAGARQLINRAWLAQQHAAELAEAE